MTRIWVSVAIVLTACGCSSSTPGEAQRGSGGSGGSGGSAAVIAGASGIGGAAACFSGDIDLGSTRVSGTITVNGAAISDATRQGEGALVLRRGADDLAQLATTSDDVSRYSAFVVPGSYDLFYYPINSVGGIRGTDSTKLQSGIVVGASPLSLDIDVPIAAVSGTVTVQGAAITNLLSPGTASLSLRNAAGDSARLTGTSADGSYSAFVVAGSYDLYYDNPFPATSALPANESAMIRSGIMVGTSPLSLDVDVPVTTVSATITVNGAAITSTSQGVPTLTLMNAAGHSARLSGDSSAGKASAGVVPGTYDLYWSGPSVGAVVPANESAKLQSGIVVGTTALSLEVDIPAATVSGTAALNGAPISPSTGRAFALRSATGDQAVLSVSGGSYSTRVIPGTYDLYYSSHFGGIVVGPGNSAFKIQGGVVVGRSDLSLDINLPAPTTVSGTVTMNGAAITGLKEEFFLYLRNAAGDELQLTAYPEGGVYSALAFPGTYDLYYSDQGDSGLERPSNRSAKIRSGIVVGSSPLPLDVDIPGTTFSGTIAVNGVPRTDFASDPAGFFLSDATTAPTPITQTRSNTGYSSFVVPGTYQLHYATYGGSKAELPSNTNADLGCFIVR